MSPLHLQVVSCSGLNSGHFARLLVGLASSSLASNVRNTRVLSAQRGTVVGFPLQKRVSERFPLKADQNAKKEVVAT